MLRDLRSILEGWEYEPGKISVRKIIGADKKEKIQARVDMGLMQFEVAGRPDGRRPHGCASLLDYQEGRLRRHIHKHGDDDGFELAPEECREMRHEAYLFHQRFVSLFVLEEFDAVRRDTDQTLRLIDLCERYAESPPDREALSTYRSYALMMNRRALALAALGQQRFEEALSIAREGIDALRQLAEEPRDDDSPTADNSGEIEMLETLCDEIIARMPENALPRLRLELEAALEAEDYEQAAKVRDQIASASDVSE